MATTPEKILASTRKMYLKEGLAGVSLRKVASKVGISQTAIYRHFESKADLMNSVMEEGEKKLLAYERTALKGRTPEDRLVLLGKSYVDFALSEPRFYELIFMLPDARGAKKANTMVEPGENPTFLFLLARVQECIDAGVIANSDTNLVALTLWSHSHGLITLYLAEQFKAKEQEFRKFYDLSTGIVLDGLRA